MKVLFWSSLLLGTAVFTSTPVIADPGVPLGENPNMPNIGSGFCPGGQGGVMQLKWCDGERYADDSYWHQIATSGTGWTGPEFRMECVVFNPANGPFPAPAPPGGCDGAIPGGPPAPPAAPAAAS